MDSENTYVIPENWLSLGAAAGSWLQVHHGPLDPQN